MIRFEASLLNDRPAHAFVQQREVRLQDIDAAGIVFYPRVLEYFSDTLLAFLHAHDTDLPAVLRERRWGAPVRHAEAHYFKPLCFGDRVEVALVRARIEETSVALGYRVARCRDGEVSNVGQTVHVFVDHRFKRMSMPESVRQALLQLPQDETIPPRT